MTIDRVDVVLEIVKILLVVVLMLNVVPIMVWVERRGSALIQDRLGPNRVGPFGLIQAMADALKFILKEDVIPAQANKWLYTLAPLFGLLPALTTIAVVPWGRPFFIPTEIMYGPRVSGVCIIGAAVVAILAIIIAGGTAKYHRKPNYSRLNFTIGAIVATALFLLALALIGVMFGIKAAGALHLPGGGRLFEPIIADVNVGILLIFALASLSVYGITTAGWSSANKFSLFGGIRASAQMISYELSLALSAVSVLMVAGSLRLTDVVASQTGYFVLFDTVKIPAWNCFSPAMWLSMIVFIVSAFAETNRLPFDFAEAEAELVAGYHTEYSSMKFAMFFMSEYIAMTTMSALVVTLFFGGWDVPWLNEAPTPAGFLLSVIAFLAKVGFALFVFVWVRWTIPRLKYDILMKIGWKIFLPLAVLNIVLVAWFIAMRWI
ncbi:MAG TPA: complex I subunit 1 family protein [Thermoanaerobaculia bacterium]|nr:complex I subunit 1 family protein [Thermoanaerobaculia bacterium]